MITGVVSESETDSWEGSGWGGSLSPNQSISSYTTDSDGQNNQSYEQHRFICKWQCNHSGKQWICNLQLQTSRHLQMHLEDHVRETQKSLKAQRKQSKANSRLNNQKSNKPMCLWWGCSRHAQVVDDQSELLIHLTNHQSELHGEHLCEWVDWNTQSLCLHTFNHPHEFTLHLESHLQEQVQRPHSAGSYECAWQGCARHTRPFKALDVLKNHMRLHSAHRPFVCQFGCGRSYTRRENLHTHHNIHLNNRPFTCNMQACTKTFSNAAQRTKHRRRTHDRNTCFQCPIDGCEKQYTDPSSRRKHLIGKHPNEYKMHRKGYQVFKYDRVKINDNQIDQEDVHNY